MVTLAVCKNQQENKFQILECETDESIDSLIIRTPGITRDTFSRREVSENLTSQETSEKLLSYRWKDEPKYAKFCKFVSEK